jgi:hypothetical protein
MSRRDEARRHNSAARPARTSISAACSLRLAPGLRLNEWIDGGEHEGATIFFHACQLGLEGTVSKRKELTVSLGALGALA